MFIASSRFIDTSGFIKIYMIDIYLVKKESHAYFTLIGGKFLLQCVFAKGASKFTLNLNCMYYSFL